MQHSKDKLDKITRLVERDGGKVVVFNGASELVVMNFDEYERLAQDAGVFGNSPGGVVQDAAGRFDLKTTPESWKEKDAYDWDEEAVLKEVDKDEPEFPDLPEAEAGNEASFADNRPPVYYEKAPEVVPDTPVIDVDWKAAPEDEEDQDFDFEIDDNWEEQAEDEFEQSDGRPEDEAAEAFKKQSEFSIQEERAKKEKINNFGYTNPEDTVENTRATGASAVSASAEGDYNMDNDFDKIPPPPDIN